MNTVYLSICVIFQQCLIIFQVQIITVLVRSIPRYFVIFNAMLSGTVSLIFPSDNPLLVYRNAIDFCILILYPIISTISLMSSNRFLMVSLGFSMIVLFPFQFGFLLLFFFFFFFFFFFWL